MLWEEDIVLMKHNEMGISFVFVILALICTVLFVRGILKKNKVLIGIAIIIGIGLGFFVYLLGQALNTM
jgi:hypothetical protein